jgi:hypothetical protein
VKAEPVDAGPGDPPAIEDCEYDGELHKAKIKEWSLKVAAYEAKKERAKDESAAKNAAWSKRVDAFHSAAAELGVADHREAIANVSKLMPEKRQAMLIDALGTDAAQLIYRLHKIPASLDTLMAIESDAQFIARAAVMAKETRIERRKAAAPAPEGRIAGGISAGAVTASRLEQIKEKARETGNYEAYFKAKEAAKKA